MGAHHALLAQLVEQRPLKPQVIGSSPMQGTERAHGAMAARFDGIEEVASSSLAGSTETFIYNLSLEINNMERAEILYRVKRVVAEEMDIQIDKLTEETSYINDLGADSLDIVDLVMELEDSLEIQIENEEAKKLTTIGETVDYIDRTKNG